MIQGLLDSLTTRKKIGEWPPAKPDAGGSGNWLSRLHAAPTELDTLNRALVTGLVLEAVLENPRLKEEPGFQGIASRPASGAPWPPNWRATCPWLPSTAWPRGWTIGLKWCIPFWPTPA
jgi:hypothetical protein